MKLTDTLNHWTAEISGKCDTAAPDPAGGIILNARGNTMYSFDPSGRIRWTWLKNAKSGVFKPMPSGDWLVSADNGNTLIAIHNGSVRWSYKSPESIQEFTIDRDGSVYLVSSGSVSTLHALSPSGVEAWRMPFTAYMGLSGGIVCDGAGRLYLAFDHYTVGGEGRYGVFCVALGRLLP